MIASDMRRHPPETPNEMIHLNYTFYTIPAFPGSTEPNPMVLGWTRNYKRFDFFFI